MLSLAIDLAQQAYEQRVGVRTGFRYSSLDAVVILEQPALFMNSLMVSN